MLSAGSSPRSTQTLPRIRIPAGLVNGQSDDTKRQVPSVLLTPQAITKDNIDVVIKDGFLKKEDICAGQFAQACTAAGL